MMIQISTIMVEMLR